MTLPSGATPEVPATDPQRAQRRAERLLGGALLGIVLLGLLSLGVLWHRRRLEVPTLPGSSGALAEALQWPWAGFPPVQPVEKETIRRDFRLGEPLLVHDLRPYLELPEGLRPQQAEARRDLDAALGSLRVVFAAAATSDGADPRATRRDVDAALGLLTRAANHQRAWVVLYDRGLIYLAQGDPRSAALDLRLAMQTLGPRLSALPAAPEARAVFLEAAVHTDYALGIALLDWAAGTEAAAPRRLEAIHALREAVRLLQPLWETRAGPYAAVAHPLGFFALRPTQLPTAALANDLVAAYLANPDFHDCSMVPAGLPCASPSKRGACVYRDRVFCLSLQRATGPFAAPFATLARRFYGGELAAWNEEFRLWALSNAVDRSAESLALEDPRLLYNFGSLLLEMGALAPAAGLLDEAADGLSRVPALRDEDVERVERLATVARVLAGLEPQTASRAGETRQPSTLRALYLRLREQSGGAVPREFPAVGRSFTPDAEATLDAWLFVRAWRQQLERGDFDGFERDYRRTLGEKDLPRRDFFVRWQTEVTTQLGERALARAAALEQAGEDGEARRIRLFVAESGSFPSVVAAHAHSGWSWVGRRFGFWLVFALILALVAGAGFVLPGLARAHRTLFVSAYRTGRLRQSPVPDRGRPDAPAGPAAP